MVKDKGGLCLLLKTAGCTTINPKERGKKYKFYPPQSSLISHHCRSSFYSSITKPLKTPRVKSVSICKDIDMMASSYMNNFILHYHNPKIHRQIPYTTLKPLPFLQKTHLHKSLQISPILKLHKPNSVLACSFSFQKVISKFISEKTVLVLLGSFLFMGLTLSYRRPVLAQPNVQETCQSEKIEDERDTQEGEEMYVKLLEQNPKNVDALKGVVYGKMRRGETKEAVEYVERLIDVEPNEVEWRLLQAFCYEMIGELSKAKRLFKDILKQRPLLIRALHVCFF